MCTLKQRVLLIHLACHVPANHHRQAAHHPTYPLDIADLPCHHSQDDNEIAAASAAQDELTQYLLGILQLSSDEANQLAQLAGALTQQPAPQQGDMDASSSTGEALSTVREK